MQPFVALFVFGSLTMATVSPSRQLQLSSYSMSCDLDWYVTVKYVFLTSAPIYEMVYKAASCIPYYGNHYCRASDTTWRKEKCVTKRIDKESISLSCHVVTPEQGQVGSDFKTFGLRVKVRDKSSHTHFSTMTPITPALVCDVKEGANFLKKVFLI